MERSRRGRVPPLADRRAGGTPGGDCRPASGKLKQTARQTALLLGAAAAILVLIAILPPLTAWGGAVILLLTLAGYGALLGFLHLFLFPLRLRRMMPGGAVSLTRHRIIADGASGLALIHSIGYLVAEPSAWRYLLPSAPLYMLAGLAALLLLAVLSLTSRHAARQRLTRSRIGFRGQHVILSALLLIAALIHVVGAGLLVDSRWKAALCALTASLAIAGLARPAPKER